MDKNNGGNNLKKLLIGGTSSGVGKTTIALGIMAALKERNLKVQPYKVGPDYIDTSYHTFITKQVSRNLDSYMLNDECIKYIFNKVSKDKDVSIIEGVMGLYDGYGTDINDCTSSYMSKLLKSPVILVIDGRAVSTSAAAMVLGFKEIDKKVNLKGVIVNNVKTESHFNLIKDSIKKYCEVEVLGYFPPNQNFELPSRHLGLIPTEEMEKLEHKFKDLGKEIEKYIDIDRLIELSESDEIDSSFEIKFKYKNLVNNKTLAVAYDKAFNFYYEDNLELIKEIGVNIVKFSPLYDKELPQCDYVYIGGGFPEIFAKELEANKSMKKSIMEAHNNNIPIYAECGGLMYLGQKLVDLESQEFEMVGIFKGKSIMTNSLKRFGYSIGEAKEDNILCKKGQAIKGHEFHHSEFVTNEKCVYTMKKERNGEILKEWQGGYSKKNTLATYLHVHFYSNLEALENFLNS
jgi:cobyrinic acid a,c-diamide synthase